MINIEELIIGQVKKLKNFLGNKTTTKNENPMIGKYVIVRCRDAGVHAGILESSNGREAYLLEARRLWYWKPANNQKYLSGVAVAGLHESSKVGAKIKRILLTENCEIIQVNDDVVLTISEAKTDETK